MAADVAGPLGVCLIVPAGGRDLDPLSEAIRAHDPGVRIQAIWAGDLQRRPVLPNTVRWADLDLDEPTGVGWGRLVATLPPEAYAWARAARAAASVLRVSGGRLVLLRVGGGAVVGPLGRWAAPSGITVIERSPEPRPADGLAPSDADLAERGRWSTAAIGVAADAVTMLDDLADTATTIASTGGIGQVIDLAVGRAATDVTMPRSGVAVGWSASADDLLVLDVDDVDPVEPWHVSFAGRPRLLLSDDLRLADAVAASVDQWCGSGSPVVLPGGLEIDDTIRLLMRDAVDSWHRGEGRLPPDPFGATGLAEWLESGSARSGGSVGRYWFEEWAQRPDLHAAFPDPMGADRDRFLAWAHGSWESDRRSPLIRARSDGHGDVWTDIGRDPGVNVIGYVAADSGLGDFTRRLHQSLVAAGTSASALHYHRTASPTASDLPPLTTEVAHATNLITVHADQMRFFADDHGREVFPGRTNIGYWFWELSDLTPRLVDSIDLVDEVWVATEFVADAYRRVTDKPVHVVPVPVPRPDRSSASRAELGVPDDRFVFLVTFDHLSITDRKNPIAAIRAFERAVPTPTADGPMLIVKTLNARHRWIEHEELQLAAARRPDITVVDQHLDRGDQMRLIELADCLVSLHRSEGLGLHLQEAMWLDTPIIATRYSGNLDFMTDDNSVLIDAEIVPVVDRQGYYPTSAVWADPSVEQAADAMRRMIDDEPHRRALADAALSDMMNQPSLAHTGHLIAGLCRDASRGVT